MPFADRRGSSAVFALLGLLAGALYVWRAPVVYEGQAVIQVDQTERRVVKIDGIGTDNFESTEALKTLEQNLKQLEAARAGGAKSQTPPDARRRWASALPEARRRAKATSSISSPKEFPSA